MDYKKSADFLWPIGATVLALLAMPLAIEQYPEFFKENRWPLPISVAVVAVCWILPFFLHERARGIFRWTTSNGAIGISLAVLVVVSIPMAIAIGSMKLFRFHATHLAGVLRKKGEESKPPANGTTYKVEAKSEPLKTESTLPSSQPQQHSKSNPVPQLKAEIKQVADGHFIGNEDDNLMLAVGISNIGEPTTVSGWELNVYDGNGHEHKTQGIYLPAGHNNIQAQVGTFILSWSGDDDLAQKLATNQVGRNKSEVGILAFQVLGVPQVGKGFELKLYCRDVTGKKYEARHVIRGDSPKNLHVPGLSKY